MNKDFSILTDKQRRIFDYVKDTLEAQRMAPSFKEIAVFFRVSIGTIQDQIEALVKKGFLEKDPLLSRALRIPGWTQEIPILGRVHAGPLHMAFENVEGHLPVGGTLSPSNHFALKIRGDSMINAGILDGDHVIVHVQQTADDGDIVVAQIEDESTVKFLRKKGHEMPMLEPANPKYESIRNTPFSIAGVVVEVRRQIKRWRK